MEYLNLNTVQEKIVEIDNQKVILDSDVAELYDVETKRDTDLKVKFWR